MGFYFCLYALVSVGVQETWVFTDVYLLFWGTGSGSLVSYFSSEFVFSVVGSPGGGRTGWLDFVSCVLCYLN